MCWEAYCGLWDGLWNTVCYVESKIVLAFHLHSVLPGMKNTLAWAKGVLASFTVGLTKNSDDSLRIQKNQDKWEK